MKKRWLQKQVDDIKQMNLSVTDRDFKRFAESNNMLAKQKRLILLQEEVSQQLVDYGLNNLDWANMYAGVFFVP
jgi:ubiquinone/menaquinone biosynthesis C-methylase UbiE